MAKVRTVRGSRKFNRDTSPGSSAWLLAIALIVIGIVVYAVKDSEPFTRDANPIPTSGSKTTQPSPQGNAGPLNTESGGAPASSPQGETPAGMQSAPQASGGPATK